MLGVKAGLSSRRNGVCKCKVLGPIEPPKIGLKIVSFGGPNGPNRAQIPSLREGGPNLSGWVGESTGPIGPTNATHQNPCTHSLALMSVVRTYPKRWGAL